jgi:hypothetical protein
MGSRMHHVNGFSLPWHGKIWIIEGQHDAGDVAPAPGGQGLRKQEVETVPRVEDLARMGDGSVIEEHGLRWP